MSQRLQALAEAGVSIWLDDLSRERIESGDLAAAAATQSVVGVTTNPTIFAAALADGERYDEQVRALVADGADTDAVIAELTTDDVARACDVLADVFAANPADGRVSIEVEPGVAMDTEATVAQARSLWAKVNRPNALIKIPATVPGLPAITAAIADGISVNVTLIFSVERYRAVMDAYLTGLEQARANGHDISRIHSVASFFVSRVDSEIDGRLETIGTEEALALRGKSALANAYVAYAAFAGVFASSRYAALKEAGANPQRPLWASTGVKNPAYPDTLYVSDLVVDGCVNTMPEKTLLAFADHGEVRGDTVSGRGEEGQQLLDAVQRAGVDLAEVMQVLETEGVEKFDKSWKELVDTVSGQMEKAGS